MIDQLDPLTRFIFYFISIGGGICLYFIPSIVATGSGKRNARAIFMLNLFLGWTFIGWVVALVWACMKDEEQIHA